MAKIKKQVRPEGVVIAPISPNAEKLEFMSSTYPIGFGYSEAGNVVLFVHDHADNSEEAVVIEHILSPKTLERIIEIAQETLDNLGRHTLGVKLR
jgi:nitrogen regulatory protein PII-like uncharacterized protein